MRITSPPKYANEPSRNSSPFNNKPKLEINTQKPVIHHLRSPSNKHQTKTSLKQNLYAQLKNRQHQYVELIKDLHQQNKNLKAQLIQLHHDQTYSVNNSRPQSPHRIGFNQTVVNPSKGFNAFRTIDNKQTMNKTFSNFTSPPKIILHQQQHPTTYRSPFAKKPDIMSNTSPEGFGPRFVRNKSPCVRPVSNIIPKQVEVQSVLNKTPNHSYQPSLISYQTSPNQSLRPSPRKNLQIRNVFSTTLKSTSPDKIVFKQTDDSKQSDDHHLNPLTSKRHKVTKSMQSQITEQQQHRQKESGEQGLDKKINENPLLSMLKKKLQEEQFLKNQLQQKQIEESQCLAFVKPSEYNHNIRFSPNVQKNDVTQPRYIIHPMQRNIFQGFPILNQLRMAYSSTEDEIESEKIKAQSQKEKVESQKIKVESQKAKDGLNLKTDRSEESRLSDKLSKQGQNQSSIQQIHADKRAMTIIKMLQENMSAQNRSQSIIHQKLQDNSEERIQSGRSEKAIEQNNERSFNFNKSGKGSIRPVEEVNRDNQSQIMSQKNKEDSQSRLEVKQQVKIVHFTNRYYCQQTEQDEEIQLSKQYPQYPSQSKLSTQSIKKSTQKSQKSIINVDNNPVTNQSIHQIIDNLSLNISHHTQPNKHPHHFTQHKEHPQPQIVDNLQKQSDVQQFSEKMFNSKSQHLKSQSKLSQLEHSFAFNKQTKNTHHHNQFQASMHEQLNKTSPIPFQQQQQTSQFKNHKYLQSNISLTSYDSSSTALKNQKLKKISNKAYL